MCIWKKLITVNEILSYFSTDYELNLMFRQYINNKIIFHINGACFREEGEKNMSFGVVLCKFSN